MVARRLTLNLLWLYGGDGLAKLLAMLAFAWIARKLGDARYGDLEFAIAVIFILNLAQEAGLGPYGAREAAKRPDRTLGLAGAIVFLRTLVVLAALAILLVLVLVLPKDAEAKRILLCYGLVLVPAPLVLNWVFQSRDEMSVVAASSLLRQGIFAGAVFLTVRTAADAWHVPLCDAAGLAAVVVFHQVALRLRIGSIVFRGAPAAARRVAGEALPLALSSLTWAVRLFFPVVALGLFAGSAETGLFASGHRLVVSMHAFVWLYFFNLLPSLSRAAAQPDRAAYRSLVTGSLRLVGWVVFPGCLFLTVLAPYILPAVYGAEFARAAPVFRVQVWMLAAAFISGHQRYALISFDRQKDELWGSLCGAAVSVGGCLALNDSLTPLSAAVIFLAAEVTTLVADDVLLARCVEPLRAWRQLIRPVLVCAAAAAVWLLLIPDRLLPAALVVAVAGIAGPLVFDREVVTNLLRRMR